MTRLNSVVALSGGVGGARLVHGLDRTLPAGALTTIVNTGDDFEHWGLSISPDLDTVMYTLADLAPVERGWGLAEESFEALSMMRRYGAPDWFSLGDRDLATHVLRSEALRSGERLTAITARLSRALGVQSPILPMCDGPFRTRIATSTHGTLSFQDWLVRERGLPQVTAVTFEGAREPTAAVIDALDRAQVVIVGPSNPYVSIDPMLALDGVRDALRDKPVIAVSPLVGGKAVKGPLANMIEPLGDGPVDAGFVARHYKGLRALVVEHGDGCGVQGVRVLETSTVMRTREDSARLAQQVLAFAETLM